MTFAIMICFTAEWTPTLRTTVARLSRMPSGDTCVLAKAAVWQRGGRG